MNYVSAAVTLLQYFSNVAVELPAFMQTVATCVQKAEQIGGEGADKLQAVIMQIELWAQNNLPHINMQMQAFLAEVEKYVNGLVAYFNEAKLWFTTTETALFGH